MKTIFKTSLFIFLAISLISCNDKKTSKIVTENGEINVISPTEFKESSVGNTVIDIRTVEEFTSGHIESAVNISSFDKTFAEQILKLDKSKPIFIYCRSGRRSASTSKKVSDLGFKKVYDLEGGIKNWAKSNYQIIK